MSDWWQGMQWRMIQTNLREIDMLDIIAEQVVSDMQDFSANVLLLNAAGIIASYPTKLPFHFQSPYLKGDSLKDIINACHAAGIRVLARTDFSKVRRPIYEAHPDWAYVSAKGQVVDYNGDIHVCLNGPYQQHYALKIMEEMFSSHDFDGIFFNMGGYQTRDYSGNYYGICHCQHCQRKFKDMYGLDLPMEEDLSDPVFRRYTEFKRKTLAAHRAMVYNFILERWPHAAVANHEEFNRGIVRQESNTAIERPLPHWQYNASDNTKWVVTSVPDMVSSNCSVDFIDFPYRHVAVSPDQQRLRLAENLANGGDVDFYLIGRLDNHEDRSGFEAIKDIFRYYAANETAYRDMKSVAKVVLIKRGSNTNAYRGWFRFLVENHILFDVLTLDTVTAKSLRPYTTVILPDVQHMRSAVAADIDAFVKAGGNLLATGKTAMFDENAEPRINTALVSLGIEKVLQVREDMRSMYFKVKDKTHFPRLVDSDLIYGDGFYVYAQYAESVEESLNLIPPHNYGPPERCYYDLTTDRPGYVVNMYGKGKSVYIPWVPGELFHRQGHVNTAWFCADILEHVIGLKPVQGNLSPMVEVTLMSKPDGSSWLLSLVNFSGHFGNTFYPPVTMTDVEVEIASEKRPESVKGLRSGKEVSFAWNAGKLRVHVDELKLFEALQIIFA